MLDDAIVQATIVGAIVGALGAIVGGALVALMEARTRRRQWERERREDARRQAAAAAAEVELVLEGADPLILPLWGTDEDVQARLRAMGEEMRAAYVALVHVRALHPSAEVRDAAQELRRALGKTWNDTTLFAIGVRAGDRQLTAEEAQASRSDAQAVLRRFETTLQSKRE